MTMNIFKLDLKRGLILVNSTPIATEGNGELVGPILKLCWPAIIIDDVKIQYRLLGKSSIFGESADCTIEIIKGELYAVTFLFDLIEFFESSILESKIIKLCEKSLDQNFLSDHPSTAFLNHCEWGRVRFFYDVKQGDLSLNIIYRLKKNLT